MSEVGSDKRTLFRYPPLPPPPFNHSTPSHFPSLLFPSLLPSCLQHRLCSSTCPVPLQGGLCHCNTGGYRRNTLQHGLCCSNAGCAAATRAVPIRLHTRRHCRRRRLCRCNKGYVNTGYAATIQTVTLQRASQVVNGCAAATWVVLLQHVLRRCNMDCAAVTWTALLQQGY